MTFPRAADLNIQPVMNNIEHFIRATGKSPALSSGAWSSANMAIYTPCYSSRGWWAREIGAYHGSAVSGNKDLGIYLPDAEGKPGDALYRLGSTAMATTNTLVHHSISVYVPPGIFYLAMALDNTTGQVIRLVTLAANGENYQTSIFTEASAFPLPATATPSKTPTAANVPVLLTEAL
jgi:hypothetical protein